VSRDSLAIGIDLGGTKIAGVLVDETGAIVASARSATRSGVEPDALIEQVARLIGVLAEAASDRPLLGVGVGVAGQVEPATGHVHHAPNLAWLDFPFGDRLGQRTGRHIAVLNDVQAATFGEWRHGAAEGVDHAVCLFVGTGIGGGIIANGALLHGEGGSAGEFGHMVLDMHGPVCRCGNRGCLEAYAGGWAIGRRAHDAATTHATAGTHLLELAGRQPDTITAAVVAEAAHAGDPLARILVREAGEALAAAAVTIVNALNPAVLILGGGVIEGLPELADGVRDHLRLWALPSAARQVRVVRAKLGADAGAVGAAAWLREKGAGP
jgi:glucokinase